MYSEGLEKHMGSKTVGGLIREAREKRGWTQAKLAEEAGVPQAAISQIETGARIRPRPKTISAIFAKLDIKEDELRDVQIPSTIVEIESAINRYPGLSNTAKRHLIQSVKLWIYMDKRS